MSIRVLFYAPVLGRGGVHRFTVSLLDSLIQVTSPDEMEFFVLAHAIDEHGIPVDWQGHFIPLAPSYSKRNIEDPDFRFYQLQRYSYTYFKQLQKVVDEHQIDIVYFVPPWWTLRFPEELIRLNAHITSTLFDFAFDTLNWQGEFGDGFRDEARKFSKYASHTAFFSAPTRQYGLKNYQFSEKNTSVIHPGPFLPNNFDTSPTQVAKTRKKFGLPEIYYLAFHPASLNKNPLTILEAMAILKRDYPESFHPLVFAGIDSQILDPRNPSPDGYLTECHQLIIQSNFQLDKDIIFVGRLEDADIGGMYGGATISISATSSEAGLNGTVFETFASETPLVYSAIPPYVDRLGTDRRYGIHFKLQDAQECAKAIHETLANYATAQERAKHAKQDLIENYTWADAAQKYKELFEQLSLTKPPLANLPPITQTLQPRKSNKPHAQSKPSDPIKVLIYAPMVGRGGVTRLVERFLGHWLATADSAIWQFKVLSHQNNEIGKPIKWGTVDFVALDPPFPSDCTSHKAFSLLTEHAESYFRQFQQMAEEADVVWLPHPWWTLRVKGQNLTIPTHFIPTVHDFAFDVLGWDDEFGNAFRREAKLFSQLATKVIFSSKTNLNYAIQHYGLLPSKGEVVYLGDFLPEDFAPDLEELRQVREKFGLPQSYFLAFHASGHKDPKTIIEAVAILRHQYPNAFRPLVLAGVETEELKPGYKPAPAYAQSVQKAIQELGLEIDKDIFALGFVSESEINGLYAGAEVCITASRSEAGISAAIFEAFAAQKPMVFSDLPQFIERLGREKEYGIHFRIGDAKDLARALQETINDPLATQKRVENAFQFFNSRSWQDIAQDYFEVFELVARQVYVPQVINATVSTPSATSEAIEIVSNDYSPIPTSSPQKQILGGSKGPFVRFKIFILNRILPALNLTSYNALERVHLAKDELSLELIRANHQILELVTTHDQVVTSYTQQLRTLSEERDQQLRTLSEERDQQLRTLSQERDRQLRTLSQERDQLGVDLKQLQDSEVLKQDYIYQLETQIHEKSLIHQEREAYLQGIIKDKDRHAEEQAHHIQTLSTQIEQFNNDISSLTTEKNLLENSFLQVSAESKNLSEKQKHLQERFNETTLQFATFAGKKGLFAEETLPQTDVFQRVLAFQKAIHDFETPLAVLEVLGKLSDVQDSIFNEVLLPLYQNKLASDNIIFWDIRMALNLLTRLIQPKSYLEIGTRLGWTLAQVISQMPSVQAYCFDTWLDNYAGVENPGADFVYQQMRMLSPNPDSLNLNFISGNSHDTLPQFFDPLTYNSASILKNLPASFDLVTVDGDHTLLGAWWDLNAVFPHVAIGGAVVFDDLEIRQTQTGEIPDTKYPDYYPPFPTGLTSLRDVWSAVKMIYPDFIYIEGGDQDIATGVAFRVK